MEKQIRKILCEILLLQEEDIVPGLKMDDVETWDSLQHIELVSTIEEEFSLELTYDDIVQMTSYDGIISTLKTFMERENLK